MGGSVASLGIAPCASKALANAISARATLGLVAASESNTIVTTRPRQSICGKGSSKGIWRLALDQTDTPPSARQL